MLADYLASIARRRWSPGELDCCTFMCDWLMICGAADAMADLRGRYHDRAGYRAIMRREGGFLAACRARFAAIGLATTRAPLAGDIALVEVPCAVRHGRVLKRPAGAICVSEHQRAVVTADIGLVISASLTIVQGWTR
jgi:hypothetical protein